MIIPFILFKHIIYSFFTTCLYLNSISDFPILPTCIYILFHIFLITILHLTYITCFSYYQPQLNNIDNHLITTSQLISKHTSSLKTLTLHNFSTFLYTYYKHNPISKYLFHMNLNHP
jgi:hypothetical protein